MKVPFKPFIKLLPSQQVKTHDEYERGYDKGVSVTIALALHLIDMNVTMDALRNNLIRMRDANK